MAIRVVVLGAGFGGLELTTILSDTFGHSIDVVLIDKGVFQAPSEALVAEKKQFGSSRVQRWFTAPRTE